MHAATLLQQASQLRGWGPCLPRHLPKAPAPRLHHPAAAAAAVRKSRRRVQAAATRPEDEVLAGGAAARLPLPTAVLPPLAEWQMMPVAVMLGADAVLVGAWVVEQLAAEAPPLPTPPAVSAVSGTVAELCLTTPGPSCRCCSPCQPAQQIEPVPPAMLSQLGSADELAEEAAWVGDMIRSWANEEWSAQELLAVHAGLGEATGQVGACGQGDLWVRLVLPAGR